MMRSSYKSEDVLILLKDVSGTLKPLSSEEREVQIQKGVHYSELLPLEHEPTEEYMRIYSTLLDLYAKQNADAVVRLARKVVDKKGKNPVLVSLARAGLPVGVLLKHCIKKLYGTDVFHYSISIIRGKGIDKNAMDYILQRHSGEDIVFVDGWTGKGMIFSQLKEALVDYPDVSLDLAVIADPANITDLCGTHQDLLIPSSCLNCTVSGLISRTILRDDIIGENDFHGAIYYKDYESIDLTYQFIERIEREFSLDIEDDDYTPNGSGVDEVNQIMQEYGVSDIGKVKPSIGETTRVLIRRVPWKILIDEKSKNDAELKPIIQLAHEKNVPIEYRNMTHYKACGIIKKVADA